MKPHVWLLAAAVITTGVVCADEGREKEDGPPPKHFNIVLIGATGDLAAKYLWRGLFDLFQKYYAKGKHEFAIYGCARKDPDQGRQLMGTILLETIKCSDVACRETKTNFVQAIQYHQLKTEKHYKALGEKIADNTQAYYGLQDSAHTYEEGRLIYLSIPPSSYAKTAKLVNEHLRARLGRPWMRVVLEKPFGHDLESAEKLASDLERYFTGPETYRIDHYLGKAVVKQILPFRFVNRVAYDKLWNKNHIERIEIVMKETLDAKGRTSFYDEVGVVRDVMQNHLTEMMTLVAMELPHNSGNITEILRRKVQLLQQVEPVQPGGAVIGQYDSYEAECNGEARRVEDEHHYITATPTFAAAVLRVNNARWEGVPFLLAAGKKLDTKASYVRVVFRKSEHCLAEADSACANARHQEAVFYIGGSAGGAKIVTTKGLPKPGHFPGWELAELHEGETLGLRAADTYQLLPRDEEDAYTSLIHAVYQGERHLFTDTASLLESWRVWTPVLRELDARRPRMYDGGADGVANLNFKIIGGDIEYAAEDTHSRAPPAEPPRQVPAEFCGDKLICTATDELIAKLSADITEAAERAVLEKGVFHFAVSGGTTPISVLRRLASHAPSFPWFHTHVWLVDERCVPLDSPESNFGLLARHLLPRVRIPHLHVHPMPVELSVCACDADDSGDARYEASITRLITDDSFDFVLLGVGRDGHTASLFPGQPSLEVTDRLVTYADGGPINVADKRMSLTFAAINKAARIAVLATGSGKRDIIDTLSHCPQDKNLYPIAGVKPGSGSLVWYVDHAAFFDHNK